MAKLKAKQNKKIIKKKRLTPIVTLKRKLWVQFSIFIRLRDANKNGYCRCCTCNKEVYWTGPSSANAGHFFTRKGSPALLFEESDVNAQCRYCNKMQRNAISWDYFLFMEKKHGRSELNRLASLRGKDFKFTRGWLEEKLKYYSQKVEQLKKEKGL